MNHFPILVLMVSLAGSTSASLPGDYFPLLVAGVDRIGQRLDAEQNADLAVLESLPGWRHFPSALLVAAVLYTQPHPSNLRHGDAKLVALARRIGDLLAKEHTQGRYTNRLDHHRDTYMWLEAYRLLERDLDDERRGRWRAAL